MPPATNREGISLPPEQAFKDPQAMQTYMDQMRMDEAVQSLPSYTINPDIVAMMREEMQNNQSFSIKKFLKARNSNVAKILAGLMLMASHHGGGGPSASSYSSAMDKMASTIDFSQNDAQAAKYFDTSSQPTTIAPGQEASKAAKLAALQQAARLNQEMNDGEEQQETQEDEFDDQAEPEAAEGKVLVKVSKQKSKSKLTSRAKAKAQEEEDKEAESTDQDESETAATEEEQKKAAEKLKQAQEEEDKEEQEQQQAQEAESPDEAQPQPEQAAKTPEQQEDAADQMQQDQTQAADKQQEQAAGALEKEVHKEVDKIFMSLLTEFCWIFAIPLINLIPVLILLLIVHKTGKTKIPILNITVELTGTEKTVIWIIIFTTVIYDIAIFSVIFSPVISPPSTSVPTETSS